MWNVSFLGQSIELVLDVLSFFLIRHNMALDQHEIIVHTREIKVF